MCCMKYFTKSFLYNQQGSKSLNYMKKKEILKLKKKFWNLKTKFETLTYFLWSLTFYFSFFK